MDYRRKIARIKNYSYMIIIILVTCLFGVNAESAQNPKTKPADFVNVYYFHGNFRCTNCHNIEQYTKGTVEKYFQKELDSGKVIFKAINVEIKGNEHFADDYQLYTKSVVLSLVKNGKEIKYDNLTKVWEYLGNKAAFCQYIKSEVEKYLKELK
ncbi:MAG: hypothetical protein JW946_06215 [Candidatus Omnitrophica bacterium]|nr:hypothetical protein [Candidatus Omnitrophota bacterium]